MEKEQLLKDSLAEKSKMPSDTSTSYHKPSKVNKRVILLTFSTMIVIALSCAVVCVVLRQENANGDQSSDIDHQNGNSQIEDDEADIVEEFQTFTMPINTDTLVFEYDRNLYAFNRFDDSVVQFPIEINVSNEDIDVSEISADNYEANVLVIDKDSENTTTGLEEYTEEEAHMINYTANQCFMLEGPFETIELGNRKVIKASQQSDCYFPTSDYISEEEYVTSSIIVYGVNLSDQYFAVVFTHLDTEDLSDINDQLLQQIAGSIRIE